jgi:hypothetical protein
MVSKKDREIIRMKYDNHCAYCGCVLPSKGWHVDEIKPVERNHHYDRIKRKWVIDKNNPMKYPERMHIDNQNPACGSCNINKRTMNLEQFRKSIAAFMKHLNEISTQYKIAKRYGLIIETDIEVKFYFETFGK